MIFDERAALLTLRQVATGEYEWAALREVGVRAQGGQRWGTDRAAARERPRVLLLPALDESELEARLALRWRGQHWEVCAARRLSPMCTEVAAAPVRVSECRLWRPGRGVDADKRPLHDIAPCGRFPGVLSGLALAEGPEEPAGRPAQPEAQRAQLEIPAAVRPEPGDLVELDGARWTVRGVEPGTWTSRCLLGRKVDA